MKPEDLMKDLDEFLTQKGYNLPKATRSVIEQAERIAFSENMHPYLATYLLALIQRSPILREKIDQLGGDWRKGVDIILKKLPEKKGIGETYAEDNYGYSSPRHRPIIDRTRLIDKCIHIARREGRNTIIGNDIFEAIVEVHEDEYPIIENYMWTDSRLNVPYITLSHIAAQFDSSIFIKVEHLQNTLKQHSNSGSTETNKPLEAEEIKIGKGTMWATWATVVVGVLAILLPIYFTLNPITRPTDDLVVAEHYRIYDSPTQWTTSRIIANGQFTDTATLPVYWKVVLANNGSQDLSVVSYTLLQNTNDSQQIIGYNKLDQGLHSYDGYNLAKLSLPIQIPPGGTAVIYVKIGILLEKTAYKIVRERFQENQEYRLPEVVDSLSTAGIDFYDNEVKSPYPGMILGPNKETAREQIFEITFETTRKGVAKQQLSWYAFR